MILKSTNHLSSITHHSKVKRGFTLVELLVAITIIGVLVGGVSIAFNNARDKGRDAKRKQNLLAIKGALTLFYQDNGKYPPLSGTDPADFTSGTDSWIPDLVPDYIQKLPVDPKQLGSVFSNLVATLTKSTGSFFHTFQQIPNAEAAAIAHDATTSSTSLSFSHTTSGSDRLLLVSIAYYRNGVDRVISGVTYNGVNMTLVSQVNNGSGQQYVSLWRLIAPPTGTNTVAVTFSTTAPGTRVVTASSYASVDQTIPLGTPNTRTGTTGSGAPSVTVSSASGELVFDTASTWNDRGTPVVGSGQTQRWNTAYGTWQSFGSTEPGSTSTTMSWSGSSQYWAQIGVAIKPAPAVTPPTVTTSAATSVVQTSATLNGSANPNGAATTGWFRYSLTNPGSCNDTFGTRAPASGGTDLGSGTAAAAYFQGISGLTFSTTYYFCAIASNSGGTAFGSVLSFTTTAPAPSAPTVDIKANGSDGPVTVNSGDTVAISWTTTNSPTSCSASGVWSGAKSTSGGTENIAVTATGTYTLTCTNGGGNGADSVTVNVNAPPPPPPPPPPPTPEFLGHYSYVVAGDRQSFTLWASLENISDSDISTCGEVPPDPGYNYCLKQE